MKEFSGYYAGINFGGWFSQCDYSKERFDGFITEADFQAVADWGFDHVRIPADYNLFTDEEGNFLEGGFARMERAIGLCRKYHLNMILDLHKTQGFSFDSGEHQTGLFEDELYQQRFYALWRELARRFSCNADMLAFELLNEVTDPSYMKKWNEMASTAIGIIREYSADINILIGGYYNNSAVAVSAIDVPVDEHIVYNFHCYEPLIFTHQGAYWVPGMPREYRFRYRSPYDTYRKEIGKLRLFGTADTEDFMEDGIISVKYFMNLFREAVQAAEKAGVPLYCGEYGVIALASTEDEEQWYADIHEAFRAHHIGHALWSYREMDFDFAGKRMDSVRDRIIETSCRR